MQQQHAQPQRGELRCRPPPPLPPALGLPPPRSVRRRGQAARAGDVNGGSSDEEDFDRLIARRDVLLRFTNRSAMEEEELAEVSSRESPLLLC